MGDGVAFAEPGCWRCWYGVGAWGYCWFPFTGGWYPGNGTWCGVCERDDGSPPGACLGDIEWPSSNGRGLFDGITEAGFWKPGEAVRAVPLNIRGNWPGSDGFGEGLRKVAEGSMVGLKAPFSWLGGIVEASLSQAFMSCGSRNPSARRVKKFYQQGAQGARIKSNNQNVILSSATKTIVSIYQRKGDMTRACFPTRSWRSSKGGTRD